MLPPGRAKLATKPSAMGSAIVVRCHDDVDVETHYVGRELGKAFGRAPRPAPFDADVATFDVTEVTRSPYERIRSR
jgi:hypothetical protein